MTDFFDRLEDQLVAKSRALSSHEVVTAPARRRRIRPRHLAVALAMIALGGSALAGSEPWRPLLGANAPGTRATLSAASPPAAQLRKLGVLRRETTEADHGVATATALAFIGGGARDVRTRYIRLLSVGSGRHPAVLVPTGNYDIATSGPRLTVTNALCVVVLNSNHRAGAKACFSGAQVAGGKAYSAAEHHVFGLVPDGVARVTFVYASSAPAEGAVRDNFFEMPGRLAPRKVVWRDAAGRQMRVFDRPASP